ncbi:MAG: crossover junction endodeoxyribonuclease RuvC [Deltaproteobacteria bacterium]|nr:crossover junction endodeoxyribonuclease RuvC [Deltaproteobacteria bacterium]
MKESRLITIDPSLTCSGWALFSISSGELMGVGKIKAQPPGRPLSERLCDLQIKIDALLRKLEIGQGDVLISEAQTTMRDPRAAFVVEQVRGIFESLARSFHAVVPGRINPRSVQYEILKLKGRQQCRADVKAAAVATVRHLYSESLQRLGFDAEETNLARNQDVVDAILVGMLALSRITSARQAGVRLEEIFDERAICERRARRKIQVAAA